ncbi:TPA: hypothetical protein ACOQ31_006174 [Bacillus cereus]|uniref:hypothetical protein n=1 Tax=Bacillus cereus TaxID=1396 RepID=UPI0019294A9C|nr:hypothetical protein [Bacillus cereus]MBL3769233.1 hypothetical protein [Bacillus cereus]MBL3775025.1 hypothetical protein [Bacillus cereus]MBL3780830.1 hypothetical protein [Bacillus cereus]MBL3792130.1 hypothetical protein [Bacillus cereus]HDR8024127.1 hypothetical protein [Bacillus cereus]
MKHTVNSANLFIDDDGKMLKVSNIGIIEMNFDTSHKQSIEPPKEINLSCNFEVPDNVKELMGMGFTPQQAWNIHFRRRSKWKALQEDLTNELDLMELLDKVIGRVEELEWLLEEIKCYEAYSWDNDRNFIDARIKKAFS